jgi:hypothetical protein
LFLRDAAITIQVKSNPLADSLVAALVIEADTTNRNEERPTGKCCGAVLLGGSFSLRSLLLADVYSISPLIVPLTRATNPLTYLHPSGKG